MNVYTVTNGLLKLTEILVNLFIMGIPILVVRTLDGYRKDRRGRGYYWLAFALVVAWTQLVFAIVGRHVLAKWLALLATLAFVAIPILVVTLFDRYRKDWRGWHYYALAYAIVAALYVTPFVLIFGLRGRY